MPSRQEFCEVRVPLAGDVNLGQYLAGLAHVRLQVRHGDVAEPNGPARSARCDLRHLVECPHRNDIEQVIAAIEVVVDGGWVDFGMRGDAGQRAPIESSLGTHLRRRIDEPLGSVETVGVAGPTTRTGSPCRSGRHDTILPEFVPTLHVWS